MGKKVMLDKPLIYPPTAAAISLTVKQISHATGVSPPTRKGGFR